MPAEPIDNDFDFPAAPGDNWPPIIGSTNEEVGPAAASTATATSSDEAGFMALLVWSWGEE